MAHKHLVKSLKHRVQRLFGRARVSDARFMRDNPQFSRYQIGEGTYGSPAVLAWGTETTLQIGNYCSLAEGVVIMLGGEHRLDWVSAYPFNRFMPSASHITGHPHSKGDVVIGNDVWIGREALLLSGIKVGDGAVIGARAVVSKDVAPYSIVAGNPARHIRYRFEPEIIARLEGLAWWNWPVEEIEKAVPFIMNADIQGFLERYETEKVERSLSLGGSQHV